VRAVNLLLSVICGLCVWLTNKFTCNTKKKKKNLFNYLD
jgi:hypothetical protein